MASFGQDGVVDGPSAVDGQDGIVDGPPAVDGRDGIVDGRDGSPPAVGVIHVVVDVGPEYRKKAQVTQKTLP